MADVSFTKKTWADGSSGGTPITASELNRMEQGIKDCADGVNGLGDSIPPLSFDNVKSAVIGANPDHANPQLVTLSATNTKGRYTIIATKNGISLWDHQQNKTLWNL